MDFCARNYNKNSILLFCLILTLSMIILPAQSVLATDTRPSTIVKLTNFRVEEHGFNFSNSEFVNKVARIAGQFGVPGLLQHVPHETKGRCGGMAYAALDYFFNNIQIPSRSTAPPDGDVLADYILSRLFHSFSVPSAQKFVLWSFTQSHDSWYGDGTRTLSNRIETPKIMRALDRGTPVVIGLVGADIPYGDYSQLQDIGDHNHQVVAYGYRHTPSRGIVEFLIYDNNHPNEGVVLTMDTRTSQISYTGSTQRPLKGFFLHDYLGPRTPPIANEAPIAIAGGPYNGPKDVPILFDGSKSSDPDGGIVSFEWDFGDGTTSREVKPAHRYSQAGTYGVTLKVTDNHGVTSSSSTAATIEEQLPTDFTLNCHADVISIYAGASRQTTCTVTSFNGFQGVVSLTCTSPNNPNIACSFFPSQVTPPSNGGIDSILTVSVGPETTFGTHDLEVRGTSGDRIVNIPMRVIVQAG
jgi:hypothetical protein